MLFDQTVAGAVGDGAARAAFAESRTAITAAGGPGVVVFDPILMERRETLIASNVVVDRQQQGDAVETFSVGPLVFGATGSLDSPSIGTPGLAIVLPPENGPFIGGTLTGDYGLCATPGMANQQPTGCEHDDANVVVPFPAGLTMFNLNTHTDIPETVTGTETWEIFEHWLVQAIVQAVGASVAFCQDRSGLCQWCWPGAPGALLTVTGASEGRIGLDLGAQADFHFDGGAQIYAR